MNSTPSRYLIGQQAKCSASFSDAATNTLVDPLTVTCKLMPPSGSVTTYVYGSHVQLVKAAVGRYYVLVDLDTAGKWYYRFESTGTYRAAGEQAIDVDGSAF
jgi:hypothetical protein